MSITFSSRAKAEMCQCMPEAPCDLRAEIYGLMLFGSIFTNREIRLTTGNPALIRRIPTLFDAWLSYVPEPRERVDHDRAKVIYSIVQPDIVGRVHDMLGLDINRSVGVRLNRALLEDDCCRAAFLRGAFLSGGSVTDPVRRYHLELVTPHYNLSREMMALLLDTGFEPKITMRKSNYVLYFKFSEGIEDFLTKVGAPVAAMRVMEAKVEKEVRNQINRQVNCETANISKTVEAAAAQVEALRELDRAVGLHTLPEALQDAAKLRLAHPDWSLAALAESLSPPISKATLNYRLKKLMAMVGERPKG